MTVCNMAIEAGARAGMVAVDDITIDYLEGRPFAPKGELWEQAVAAWQALHSDPDAGFDQMVRLDAAAIKPQVTWGTSPEMVAPVDARIPDPTAEPDPVKRGRDGTGTGLYGPASGHADRPDSPGQGLHRFLHQWPDRGFPGGGRRRPGPEGGDLLKTGAGGAGLRPGEATGRSRRPGQDLYRRPASNGASRAAPCAWR